MLVSFNLVPVLVKAETIIARISWSLASLQTPTM